MLFDIIKWILVNKYENKVKSCSINSSQKSIYQILNSSLKIIFRNS